MSPSTSQDQSVKTIRITDAQLSKLLDAMDGNSPALDSGRISQRYAYRLRTVAVSMQQPGSSISVPFVVPTRNLSAGGMSFLHGGFVHAGTRSVTQLTTIFGAWTDVPGKVIRCRYLETKIHEVALEFDKPIDPSIYCSSAIRTHVLLAEDDPSSARLATFHLEQLSAEVDHAENGQIAIEKAMSKPYDLIMMDMEMPVVDGFGAVKTLRERGYTGLIVAATAMSQPEDQARCMEVGCDKYISKPFTRETLSELVLSLRKEPLFSSLQSDPSMAKLIDAYVEDVAGRVKVIEEALAEGNAKHLEKVVRTVKGEGSSYGFETISELAEKIESALIAGESIDEVRGDVIALVRLCKQAHSSGEGSSSTESTDDDS